MELDTLYNKRKNPVVQARWLTTGFLRFFLFPKSLKLII